jgi:arginine decarboxylase
VLVFNILDVNEVLSGQAVPPPVRKDEHPVIQSLAETWRGITRKNFQEAYHDALQLKDEATSLFNLGYLDLQQRARVEQLFWGTCDSIVKIIRELEYVPDDLEGLQKGLADTYFGNFSVFQSAPDHWAVKQLFPVVPLHRLNERPTRRGVFADLTCDSDGKMDRFIDLRDVKTALELHPWNGQPYYMGVFLVGAYQEILGDLHNLFGDTNAIHVRVENDGYFIDHVVEGDSVTEVLGYVQYDRADLVRRVRRASEDALRRREISFEESALLLRRFEEGLSGYTYLEEDTANLTPMPSSNAASGFSVPPAANGSPSPPESPAHRDPSGTGTARARGR